MFGPAGKGDRIARRLLLPLALLFGLLVLIFWVVYTPLKISGDSMLPTLRDADRALVTRGYTTPSRGDVVHVDARAMAHARGAQVVKRVVALPGDTVSIDRGRAVVNGVPEPDEVGILTSPEDVSLDQIVVPDDHLYVLGDNRPYSLDSRFYGPVPLSSVTGRLVFRFSPATRLGRVD